MAIPVKGGSAGPPAGYLLPVNNGHVRNEIVVECLTRWRRENQHAYTGRFFPTKERTVSWLQSQVLENSNRMLFLVADCDGTLIGHMGLAINQDSGDIEVDNVVRGESNAPGLMGLGLKALENFAESELSLESISLRVLLSNARAVKFYSKLGYRITAELPVQITYSLDFEGPRLNETDAFLVMQKKLNGPLRPEQVLTAGPLVGSLEAAYASDAARNGWNGKHSDYIQSFEQEFADFVGSKYAMATSSCTGALHLALLAAGVGPGDEVIVPETTWVATASAIAYTGASPIFCDVNIDTWTIDVGLLESKITERTKAILPVHLYGFPADIKPICAIASKYGISVIEDAAPAIGATVDGKAVGTFGDIGCYSFQGAKLLVTGEGGMLTTDDEGLYVRAKKLQDHGRKPGTFWIDELGYKYKMSNITAALGLAQMRRVGNQIFRKQRIRSWYEEGLAGSNGISFQLALANSNPIHWMTSIRLIDSEEDASQKLMSGLQSLGIDTRPVFPAISTFEFWGNESRVPGPNSLKISKSAINLPSGVGLSQDTIQFVCDQIRRLLKN